ncbi:MAG: NAD(P)H-binding protein [Rhodoferax sp.]|nr:NAD(P)H-binding protein [Rhodoferax sp.]
MTSIAVLGATGQLGSHVTRQVLDRGWELSVAVRSPNKLSEDVAGRARVISFDLDAVPLDELARFVHGHDALVCCAGYVTQGQGFVALIDRVVSAIEFIPAHARPVCWFLGGAALLGLDTRGRRGVDLPKIRHMS